MVKRIYGYKVANEEHRFLKTKQELKSVSITPVNLEYSPSGRRAIQILPILLKLGNNLLPSGLTDDPGHECLPNILVLFVRFGA